MAEFVRTRSRLALAGLACSLLGWWLVQPTILQTPPRGSGELSAEDAARTGLAQALAREGLFTDPQDIWLVEPEGRASRWAPHWQPVFFGAADPQGLAGGGDLYRAELRFHADGRPLQLRGLCNVTQTSSTAEGLIWAAGSLSLWRVEVEGLIQGLLLIDALRDEREFEPGAGLLQQGLALLTNRLQTGQFRGIGMYSFDLLVPAQGLRLEQQSGAQLILRLARGRPTADQTEAAVTRLVFDLEQRRVIAGQEEVSYRPRVWAGTPLIHWLVDTVRSFSWVGPRPIALLEKWVFTAEDLVRSLGYRLGLIQAEQVADTLGLGAQRQQPGAIKVADQPRGEPGSEWPPPNLRPLVAGAADADGEWFPYEAEWLKKIPGAPPAFYKAALRLPGSPPYVVVLVAMDLRQLELGLVAGLATPWSSTGRQGSGRIPREPERLGRTVAAFNGGFQTAHGAFGMMVERQLILEPWQKSATLAVREDGVLLMGTWNNSLEVPPEIVSFRQNMPPLLEDGVWNPLKQAYWGGTVSDLDQVNTTRSAVGYRGKSQLIYAISQRISAKAIAEALLHAGCEYGMHLDMNPAHAGFGLLALDLASLDRHGNIKSFKGLPPSKAQGFDLDRFANRNGKDFFYLLLRQPLAARLPQPPVGFGPWSTPGWVASADQFLPPFALARHPEHGGVVIALEEARLQGTYQVGSSVVALQPPDAPPLPPVDATLSHPVGVLDVGGMEVRRPLGVTVAGRRISPLLAAAGGLSLDEAGQLMLIPPVREARRRGIAPEARPLLHQFWPLLVAGQLSPLAQAQLAATPHARHHALGRDGQGTLYYLALPGPAEELATRLTELGVEEALLLPDEPGSRFRLLRTDPQAPGGELLLEDPVRGERQRLTEAATWGSRFVFDLRRAPRRIERLRLPEVQLSPEEQRRQARIQERIKEKRAQLREFTNAQYREYINQLREQREQNAAGRE